jgi:hypothetical protein
MRVSQNGKGNAIFWAARPIEDSHQMPPMRSSLLSHKEEDMRCLRIRRINEDSTLLMAEQERKSNEARLKEALTQDLTI